MTTVIYHKSDWDGIMCREIARKALGDKPIYVGYEYGDPVPVVPFGDLLYLLDISIPELMDRPLLTWIDHHKTAIDKFGMRAGSQVDGVAACRLAWNWWFCADNPAQSKEDFVERRVSEPYAVRMAGEYDVWDKRDPNAELFQHGLRSRELTPETWRKLFEPWPDNLFTNDLLQAGLGIEYYVKSQNAEIIQNIGFDLDWEGLKFLALNAARYNSLNFDAGIRPEHDGLLGFKWTGDKWSVSMYGVPGKPDIDFSEIVKRHGGGGHKQACGFTAKSLPWLT